MRCFSCNNFSIEPVCKNCIRDFLIPQILTREIDELEVISFFDYYLVSEFIKSKYTPNGYGYRMYKFFANGISTHFLKSISET